MIDVVSMPCNTKGLHFYSTYFQGPAVIVTVLCDLGIKYLSKVYNDEWLETNKINI